jgi:hypothetical protein
MKRGSYEWNRSMTLVIMARNVNMKPIWGWLDAFGYNFGGRRIQMVRNANDDALVRVNGLNDHVVDDAIDERTPYPSFEGNLNIQGEVCGTIYEDIHFLEMNAYKIDFRGDPITKMKIKSITIEFEDGEELM